MEEKEDIISKGRIISAIFLVSGTCIGGGMLALPVTTGISGFFPSALMMALCWLAMTASALLLLEVNLWLKEGAHIITMASTLLGPIGKTISWFLYLFICYASLVAYTAAGGSLVANSMHNLFDWYLTKGEGCCVFIVLFGSLLYFGNQLIGRVNTILFIAMITAYVALIGVGVTEVKIEFLKHYYWPSSFLAIPLLLTTFSFQTMLPSLTPYLKRNVSGLRWAIIGGTTLTFIVYLVWQYLALGIVPLDGPQSLIKALELGEPITQFLREHVQNSLVSTIAEYFAFFALVTSFLGMALGLFDFLADGLAIPNKGKGKIILSLLIIIPTLFISSYFERLFVSALDASGGYGDTILNGIIPVMMVWMGRYVYKFPNENRTPGGKPLLIIVGGFFILSLVLKILIQSRYIISILEICQQYQQDHYLN